ncbi:type II toxin-antitoxin system RelE/ParE family toxin [Rhizobium sp.]
MKRVEFSLDARAYIKAEASYLKARSPAAGARFRASLGSLRRNLTNFPGLGHRNPEAVAEGIFRFVMDEYLVDYEVIDGVVIVITIRHGRQAPPNQPPDPDDDYEAT